MADLTIENFWARRLSVERATPTRNITGWNYACALLDTFVEAPLTVSAELDVGEEALTAEVLLVAAPGAVGKSTLARQIAAATNAIYVDLAEADAVGGTSLSGALARSGLYGAWENDEVAVLIDGLDEARLRVTQQGFEAFLKDVGETAAGRSLPTILFGRTGAVEEAWLELSESGAKVAVLEIGYYEASDAACFAETMLRAISPDRTHEGPQREAIDLILAGLRERTEGDRGRFAGYAPVLSAVAERVARDPNPAGLIAEIQQGKQPITLKSVLGAIMERERKKLGGVQFENPSLIESLYGEREQLIRLACLRYGVAPPPIPAMSAADMKAYGGALETWVGEHPFLNGLKGASAVFDAIIVNTALSDPHLSAIATDQELGKGVAANPFLSEFFIREEEGTTQAIKPELVGLVYNSLRAQLSIGQTASLSLDGVEADDDMDRLAVEIEVTIEKGGVAPSRVLNFVSEQIGIFRLGPHVHDVDASLPDGAVELGAGDELVLVAPVNIQCQRLKIISPKLVVEGANSVADANVALEADVFDGASVTAVPIVRGATLSAAWPNVRQHPWTAFASPRTEVAEPGVEEGLRRLRKFVIAFRSHSKGALKRYRAKLDHSRMTKGSGKIILDKLIQDEILSVDGPMYVLDPSALAKKAGASYSAAMSQNYSDETLDYVKSALAR